MANDKTLPGLGARPLHVLLVGATGVFGQRLARQLAAEPGVALIVAGRTMPTLEGLARELGGNVKIAILDRDRASADQLTEARADVVIDAAGPYQGSKTTLIEAAIGAGCHYLDLADGRTFVANISHFDTLARERGIAVLSGASTSPALSHAVTDHLTRGWCRIDTLRVAISLGNRAPRGLAVIRAVLSYVGRPVRHYREGGWTTVPGWGLTRRILYPGLGWRLGSLCETPDLDLLVKRYKPRAEAIFLAGVGSPALHRGLSLAGLVVRAGLVRSLLPFARPFRFMASLVGRFGSDRGGMVVAVAGQDSRGKPVRVKWLLAADSGRGPNVPTLAALALVRRIRDGRLNFRGAAPCVGILDLEDFSAGFEHFGIKTQLEKTAPAEPVFAAALGAVFPALPAITRQIHSPDPVLVLTGKAEVTGAENRLGRMISRLFGLPGAAREISCRVVIEAMPDSSERWSRVYGERVMRSRMCNAVPAKHTLEEHFGPFRFVLRLDADGSGLALIPVSARLWKLPLPAFLVPRIEATERADGGKHRFDVAIALPVVGRLVRYRGWLCPSEY